MIDLQLPDGASVALSGEPDGDFLRYLRDVCPEVWADMLKLRGAADIAIDLASAEVSVDRRPLPKSPQVEQLLHDVQTVARLPNRSGPLSRGQDVAVVLCGGAGKRMRSDSVHKVCFPVGSRTVISRALDVYSRAGLGQQLVVVGAMADHVVAEIQRDHPGVRFAYQSRQLGTGHAAQQAAYALREQAFTGDIMLTMGDKVISQAAIEKLRSVFLEQGADAAITVSPKNRWPNSGRVVYRSDGTVDCSIERSDMTKGMLLQRLLNKIEAYEITTQQAVAQLIAAEVPDEGRARIMFGPALWDMIRGTAPFDREAIRSLIARSERVFTLEEADGSPLRSNAYELEHRCSKVNISVYYFKADALYYALEQLDNDNAQGQFYLTDVIQILSRARDAAGAHRYKAIAVDVDDPEEVLSYDTREELQYIEDRLRANAVERLRGRGVSVQGYFRHSWVDDLDSIDKIGEGTELQEPTVIDLGPDPECRIGKRCRIRGTIVHSALGDDCVVEGAELHRVIAGDDVAVRHTKYAPAKREVVPSGVAIVSGDFTQLEQARAKQRSTLEHLRQRYEELGQEQGRPGMAAHCAGDVDETNFHVDPRMIEDLADSGTRLLPGTILLRRASTTVGEWLALLEQFPPAIVEEFETIYGHDPHLIQERRHAYTRTLSAFGRTFGYNNRVIISRAPGRINLMGRHVDHQGGHINQLAINREVIMAVQRRDDDRVVLQNVDADQFQPGTFLIGEEFTIDAGGNWLQWINSDEIKGRVEQTQGNWSNYVKAALFRLQEVYKTTRLYGMNMMVCGNIPIAAGLSSSSAIVVATAEAAVRINELDVTPQQFVDMCGEGEWYVGTRGGSGDHAAMKFGAKGSIAHVRFLPFSVEGFVQFPEGYKVVVCQSQEHAHKAAGARNIFNSKVATYRLGFLLIQEGFPRFADRLDHLRDVNADHLGVGLADIYEILRALPERATREQIRQRLQGKHEDKLAEYFATHDEPPGGYELRKVCLFGLGECARTAICPSFLARGDIDGFGQLMRVSHDGDRVARLVAGAMEPYDNEFTDAKIDQLLADLASQDPARVARGQMHMQPGGYGCSTSDIDHMVDLACGVDGVAGAQLAGAGLGGCIMVLVREGRVDALVSKLAAEYYRHAAEGGRDRVEVCAPIAGSGAIEF